MKWLLLITQAEKQKNEIGKTVNKEKEQASVATKEEEEYLEFEKKKTRNFQLPRFKLQLKK